MVGSVLFAASRELANEQLAATDERRFHTEHTEDDAARARGATREAIDEMVDLSVHDPARDEEQFVHGMRKLVASLLAPE